MSLTEQFARESGYTGDSPAMLETFEKIRQLGIREARAAHFQRKAVVDQFKAAPWMFFSFAKGALSTDEAIEQAERYIASFRNMETWKQERRRGELAKAKLLRVYGRFFRRFGQRAWAKEAA